MKTINNLKNELGYGLGVKKNNYMLEIPIPSVNGYAINILCQSASLPTRNIATTDMFHKGRKYTLRAETDYGGEYEITVLDDDSMSIRKSFDKWLENIDNSAPKSLLGDVLGVVDDITTVANAVAEGDIGFLFGLLLNNGPGSKYQTDITIWQLSSTGEKIYGYILQNSFPKSLGAIEYSDSSQHELCSYTINFAFSELKPITSGTFGAIKNFFTG